MTTTTIDDCGTDGAAVVAPGPKIWTRVARERAPGWAERLVTEKTSAPYSELFGRAVAGLGLAALYGLALGARQGGKALAIHAVGVPLGLLVVVLAAAPSLFVFLSICRAQIDARALAGTGARGIGSAGLLLAGLAPAAALFVVSSETPKAAAGAVLAGLVLGGGVALGRATWEVFQTAVKTPAGAVRGHAMSMLGGTGVAVGFAVFSVVLAIRIWSTVLPILGGAS
jgi:hypothetical protein